MEPSPAGLGWRGFLESCPGTGSTRFSFSIPGSCQNSGIGDHTPAPNGGRLPITFWLQLWRFLSPSWALKLPLEVRRGLPDSRLSATNEKVVLGLWSFQWMNIVSSDWKLWQTCHPGQPCLLCRRGLSGCPRVTGRPCFAHLLFQTKRGIR